MKSTIPLLLIFINFIGGVGCSDLSLSPSAQKSAQVTSQSTKPRLEIGTVIGTGKMKMTSLEGPVPSSPGATSPSTPPSSPLNTMLPEISDLNISPTFWEQHFVQPKVGMKWVYKATTDTKKMFEFLMPPTSGAALPNTLGPEKVDSQLSYQILSQTDSQATVKVSFVLAPVAGQNIPTNPLEIEAKTPVKEPSVLMGLIPNPNKPGESSRANFQITIQLSVAGSEDVTVPAGTFKNALKLRLQAELPKSAPIPESYRDVMPQSEDLIWITPEEGVVKRVGRLVSKNKTADITIQELQVFQKP